MPVSPEGLRGAARVIILDGVDSTADAQHRANQAWSILLEQVFLANHEELMALFDNQHSPQAAADRRLLELVVAKLPKLPFGTPRTIELAEAAIYVIDRESFRDEGEEAVTPEGLRQAARNIIINGRQAVPSAVTFAGQVWADRLIEVFQVNHDELMGLAGPYPPLPAAEIKLLAYSAIGMSGDAWELAIAAMAVAEARAAEKS